VFVSQVTLSFLCMLTVFCEWCWN